MKEKFIIILSSLLLLGCQQEEKFVWEAAMFSQFINLDGMINFL